MKIRRSLLWFTAILAMLIVLLIWFGHKKPIAKSLGASAENTSTLPTTTALSESGVSAPGRTNASVAGLVTATTAPKQPIESQEHRMMEALSGNHVTIVFYGKVEDQTGNPVVNAVVSFDVRVLNGYESTVKRGQQTTDANGFFTISGYKGQDLTVIPQKEGYTLGTTRTLFTYSHLSEGYFVPDAGNPTVIKMWKLQGADHLIHYQTEVRVPIDGTPVTFDFQTGQRVQTGGDVRVRIETTPTPNVIQRYDWHATIQAVNGGLITSDADFDRMFMAPDSGYQPEITNSYQRDIKPWSTTFNGVFYFTSRNGSSYGKLGIEVLSDVVKNATVPVILNSYVNPASSRNLEIDPKLVTEAHP